METKSYKWIGFFVIALAVVVAALIIGLPEGKPAVFLSGTVAIVDGEKLNSKDLNRKFEQIAGFYETQGIDTSSEAAREELKFQILETAINEVLIAQYARRNGLEVSDKEVKEEYLQIAEQFGGRTEFEKAIALENVSAAEVQKDIKARLIAEASVVHFAGADALNVSDEEIQSLYDDYGQQFGDLPELESVKPILTNEIKNRKFEEIVFSLLEGLKTGAQIDILI